MKRVTKFLGIFAALAVFNLFTVAVILANLPLTVAGTGGSKDCAVGDVNGDSSTGLGDAIYLLNYLFTGGPDPVACAGDEPLSSQMIAAGIESAMAKFRPRGSDLFEFMGSYSSSQEVEILTVPKDKVFVMTNFGLGGSNGSGTLYLNDEQVSDDKNPLQSSTFFSGLPREPLHWTLRPGDTLKFVSAAASSSIQVIGHWCDL